MARKSQRRRQGGKNKVAASKKPTSALKKEIIKSRTKKVDGRTKEGRAIKEVEVSTNENGTKKSTDAAKLRSNKRKAVVKATETIVTKSSPVQKSPSQGKLVSLQESESEGASSTFQSSDEDELSLEEPSSSDIEKRPRSRASLLQSPKKGREPAIGRDLSEKVKLMKKDKRFAKMSQHDLIGIVKSVENEEEASPSFIAVIQQAKEGRHRTRVRWELWEENELKRGVALHGNKWSTILNDSNLRFQDRTQVDLKDKWRNLTKYRPYGEVPWRRFMLVDENHTPILTRDKKNPHVFKNRWPIEAAIKAATKDFVYPEGQETAEIYLKDIEDDARKHKSVSEVHVFQVHREQEAVVGAIPKFEGMKNAWCGKARKIRVERFLTKSVVLKALGGQNYAHQV